MPTSEPETALGNKRFPWLSVRDVELGMCPTVALSPLVGLPASVGFLATVADERPGEGPLAAVATALRAGWAAAIAPADRARGRPEAQPGDDEIVLVAACDLVRPSSVAFGATVRALAATPAADAAVPVADGQRQWDQAAWRYRALSRLDTQLGQGERSVRRAVVASGLVVHEVHGLDPALLADADTPEELPGGRSRPGGPAPPALSWRP